MAQIELLNVTKRFGQVEAIKNINLEIKDNEFLVLFGPAGAGKTTMLKCIAGIEFPQEGIIKIGGKIVNHVEPAYRNVSMVFENYALYPNLSVYDNIASPLRSKLYRKEENEIREAIERVVKLMKIEGLYDRIPSQLSNGQRQRVAIGRCLVRNPNVFLMDEPLAHLDAKLRHIMRTELKEMQSAFNTTTIYVTHDYMEAMSLADRIAVMDKGEILQTGTAYEMYYKPNSEFIAKLFGEPEINIFPARYIREGGKPQIVADCIGLRLRPADDVVKRLEEEKTNVIDLAIRGNDIQFALKEMDSGRDDENVWLAGTVYANEPIGNKVILTVDVKGTHIQLVAPNDTKAPLDSKIYLRLNFENLLYFDGNSRMFITRHNIENAGKLKRSN